MKIRHNIKRYGKILRGQILETIFESPYYFGIWGVGEGYRGDRRNYYSKDGNFCIKSSNRPALLSDMLYVWGNNKEEDLIKVQFIYDTKEDAQKALDYINEFRVGEKEKEEEEKDICFPQRELVNGQSNQNPSDYISTNTEFPNGLTDTPIRNLEEGDLVYIKDDGDNWSEKPKIFLMKSKKGKYLCVSSNNNIDYENGKDFKTYCWREVKKVEPKKMTKEEIEKKLGYKINIII